MYKRQLRTSTTVQNLSGIEINVKQLVNSDNFVYGDMTSVAVSPDGMLLAAAIQAQGTNDDGRVALFSCNQDGSLTFIQAIPTGKQPDMVTFTPDGSKSVSYTHLDVYKRQTYAITSSPYLRLGIAITCTSETDS